MRVAAYQFDVRRGDVAANLRSVEQGLRAAAAQNVELLVLPEMWPTSFVAEGEDEHWLRKTRAAWRAALAEAASLGMALAGSAFGEGSAGQRLRNRFRLQDPGGEVLRYDKTHLFSPTGEAAGFSAGEAPPSTVEWRGLRVSAAICYDLRFGALMWSSHEAEAELLIVPAQWPVTRAAHWRALLVGRAVEHQAFVIGANRTGRDRVGRRELELDFPGHSLIVSPHGDVLAEGQGEAGLVVADLDPGELRALRRRVPMRRDGRPDLYLRS